jgi:TIR domain
MGKHDVFICFSSKDEEIARSVVQFLEARAIKCWISARDVEPGQNYQESIVHALEAAKVIVFLFSENSNRSGEIKKELSLGASSNIVVIPLRLSAINPSGALRYELATRQWVDFFPDRDLALGRLVERINGILRGGGDRAEEDVEPIQAVPRKSAAPIIASGSQELEAVRSLLARHIGPIAKIFVQKAAADAASLDDFCERLAAHVPTPTERAAFLQAARARLRGES